MGLFGNNKKDSGEYSSSPVVSDKTKSSASFLKKTVSKIGSLFKSKKLGDELTAEPMSNTEYLGEIYKLMVQNHDDIKLERQQIDNRKEEEDSEEQKRHSEIIKALTLRRRPKPKRVERREKKAEEKAAPTAPSMPGKPGKKPGLPSAPSKPSQPPSKPAETKPTQPSQPSKPAEPSKPAQPSKPAEPAKPTQKPAETKPAEPAKSAEKPVDKTKKDTADKAKKEADDRAKKAADDKAKKEADDKAKKEADDRAKKDTAEKLKKEEQERLKREAAEKEAKKSAEPVKPPEAPKPPTPAPKPAAPKPPPSATKIPKGMTKAAAILVAAMSAAGITNVFAQRAILANVQKETQGTELEENLLKYKGTSAARIREVFPQRVKHLKDFEIDVIKKDPYKFAELVYGKDTDLGRSMGNTEEGDGYKYRGRGYIQLTGKNNYKEYSKIAGIDLVKNPDALLEPELSAKISAEFLKRGRGKKGLEFTNQEEANRAVTQTIGGARLNLNEGIGAKLLSTVDNYSKNYSDVGTGSQIDQASKDNKDMKSQNPAPPPNVQQNTTNVNNTTESSAAPNVNDRSKHDRK